MPGQTSLFDFGEKPKRKRVKKTAEEKRDAALEAVAEESFMERSMKGITAYCRGEITGEEIRMILTGKGIVPHHHNAWGAVVMTAIRRRILVDTGRTTRMSGARSHARKTSIYRIVCP